MTFDFSHLKQYDLTADVRRTYTFRHIKGAPRLTCAPASSWLPEFERAARDVELAAGAKPGAREDGKALTMADLTAQRRTQIPVFAAQVVKDWVGVKDATGADVPCSREAVAEFLAALPDLMFAEFVVWVTNVDNFRTVYDAEGVAKN